MLNGLSFYNSTSPASMMLTSFAASKKTSCLYIVDDDQDTVQTTTLVSQLIQSLEGDKGFDILGVPLFEGTKIQDIWAKQSQHVACLQDPQDVRLYTQVKTVWKGGVELPVVYRCARGSTSLESFHLHMNRFIPGK